MDTTQNNLNNQSKHQMGRVVYLAIIIAAFVFSVLVYAWANLNNQEKDLTIQKLEQQIDNSMQSKCDNSNLNCPIISTGNWMSDTNEKHKYSIKYPYNWKVSLSGVSKRLILPKQEGRGLSIEVRDTTEEDFIATLQNIGREDAMIQNRQQIDINGIQATSFDFYNDLGTVDSYILMSQWDNLYIIQYYKDIPELLAMIGTFKFEETIYTLAYNGGLNNRVRCSDDLETILGLYSWLNQWIPEQNDIVQFCLNPHGKWGLLNVTVSTDYYSEDSVPGYGTSKFLLIDINQQTAKELYTRQLGLYEGCWLEGWSSSQISYICRSGDAGVVNSNAYVINDWETSPNIYHVQSCDDIGTEPFICNKWTEGDWCEPGQEYGDTGILACRWLNL